MRSRHCSFVDECRLTYATRMPCRLLVHYDAQLVSALVARVMSDPGSEIAVKQLLLYVRV